jgi:hypothetical protein
MASKKDVKSHLRDYGFVFKGTLTNVEYVEPERFVTIIPTLPPRKAPRRFVATFKVTDVWKGPVAATYRIHTREPDGDCIGFPPETNKGYLVFAFLDVITVTPPNVWRLLDWNDLLPLGSAIMRMEEGCGTLSGETTWDDVKDTLKRLGRPLK